MSLPLDHVYRPGLPWRDSVQTECGLPGDSYPTLSRDELRRRLREMGQQRTALTVCMTCLNTAQRWPTWDENPVHALERETYLGRRGTDEFRNELLAIAALVAHHRDEFDQLLSGIGETIQLSERRRRRTAR